MTKKEAEKELELMRKINKFNFDEFDWAAYRLYERQLEDIINRSKRRKNNSTYIYIK